MSELIVKTLLDDLELPLEDIIINDQLILRPQKAPNYEVEARALRRLAKKISAPRATILQELSDIIFETCNAGSAGVSISEVENGEPVFRWHAISGQLRPFLYDTVPGKFSPCGVVVDRNSPILMEKPIRHFKYYQKLGTPIYEVLLCPFYREGKVIGTIWVTSHSPDQKFDREDYRILKSLSQLASPAVDSYMRYKEVSDQNNRLSEEKRRYENIFSQSSVPTAVLKGPEHRFLVANRSYCEMFGIDADLSGKRAAELFPDGVAQGFLDILDGVYSSGEAFIGSEVAFERSFLDGNKKTFYFDFTYAPQKDLSGKTEGIVATIVDVTEKVVSRTELERAKAEAESANLAKSAFLANMSHEIRTPLGAVMGFCDLARQCGTSNPDIKSYLGTIERNSNQVLRIIDDILDLAKVEAGRVVIENVCFSLAHFLADFMSVMDLRARENGISLCIVPESDLPERVVTDPTRLRQILTNAVGNAIKFTSKGSVTVHVSYADSQLSFRVADTGRGISAEQSKVLFQAFVQADASTTRKFGGTGLGLVLTKHLCQLMGGDYVLEKSELKVGSTFLATLKLDPSHSPKLIPKDKIRFSIDNESQPREEPRSLEGLNILLVEDSPDNQVLVRLLLEQQGAIVDISDNGVEGIEKALGAEFDLVLMDIQMPRMDGHEAMKVLKSKDYPAPVVALTAHAMKEETERAKESGFTGILTKPINRQALINKISELTT